MTPRKMTFRRDRAVKALKLLGCRHPEMCADFPQNCACPLLKDSKTPSQDVIRLGEGLALK